MGSPFLVNGVIVTRLWDSAQWIFPKIKLNQSYWTKVERDWTFCWTQGTQMGPRGIGVQIGDFYKWFSDINSIILPKFTSRCLDTDLKCVLTILQIRFFSPFMWDIVSSTYFDQRFSTFNRNFLHLSSLLFRRCFRLSDFQFPCHYKFSSKIKTTMIHFLWGKKIKDIISGSLAFFWFSMWYDCLNRK